MFFYSHDCNKKLVALLLTRMCACSHFTPERLDHSFHPALVRNTACRSCGCATATLCEIDMTNGSTHLGKTTPVELEGPQKTLA